VTGSSYEVEERFRSSRGFRIVDPLAAARAFSLEDPALGKYWHVPEQRLMQAD
jgi:hypothetical protein